LELGGARFVYEDPRYFGRLTLDTSALASLGPEPLSPDWTPAAWAGALQRSRQPIKVKLLDQGLVAGVGNIYASEALFAARLSPTLPANTLSADQTRRLWRSVRRIVRSAIQRGSTVPLNWSGKKPTDRFFYYGSESGASGYDHERLRVYDRAGQPCPRCATPVQRLVQAARSTYFCPQCQATGVE
jgi:formamidopyrimidine-DNA glycosylase